MNKINGLLFCVICMMLVSTSKADDILLPNGNDELNQIIARQVAETYDFAGMALYLNQITFFAYDGTELKQLDQSDYDEVELFEKIVVVGRFKAMVIDLNNSQLKISNNQLIIEDIADAVLGLSIVNKKDLARSSPEFKSIRYHHLWWPLAQLSIFFEAVLEVLGKLVHQSWGWAILLFAVIIKVIFIPLSIVTARVQSRVNDVQGKLIPELNAIKAEFDGQVAHDKIMAAHKKMGVSPFFTMKPLLMTLIQIPFLIAIFNTLGEMQELKGASFLWFSDLSLPDMLFNLGQNIPMFGSWFNLLPFLMVGITLLATIKYRDDKLPVQTIRNQRIRLYLMALVFFILFYPFPAAMVYYWSLVNLWQLAQQKYLGN